MKNIAVYIEELVLYGFVPGDRYRIADAVERELARLFAEQGVPPSLIQDGEVVRLDGGVFEVAQDSKPETIGAQVAQAVYGGIEQVSNQALGAVTEPEGQANANQVQHTPSNLNSQ
jgi:hypothetical protein